MLVEFLKKVGWEEKEALYSPFFVEKKILGEVKGKKLSVIILSWQWNSTILECLKKLRVQRDCEVIFVNNGQPQKTFERELDYVDIYLRLNENLGDCRARNIGAVFASTPILCFLDDDALPEDNFVQAHIDQYAKYDIIGLRGRCKPKTPCNLYNKLGRHYELGTNPYPRFSDLEGNSSYLASFFYQVKGWDDEIFFGHSGIVLSKKLLEVADFRRQIYSPDPTIYHDYVSDEKKLEEKSEKHKKALELIEKKYGSLNSIRGVWEKVLRKEEEIPRKKEK